MAMAQAALKKSDIGLRAEVWDVAESRFWIGFIALSDRKWSRMNYIIGRWVANYRGRPIFQFDLTFS